MAGGVSREVNPLTTDFGDRRLSDEVLMVLRGRLLTLTA